MIDSTVTLAIIVSLCALISAPVTALINNRHQLNLRKLELQFSERRRWNDSLFKKKYEAYKAFIDAAMEYRINSSYQFETNMLSTCQSAMLLCNSKTLNLLVEFQNNIPKDKHDFAEYVSNISEAFNCELTELSATE